MAWLRVDDRFAYHPKVRRAGNAPVGLWVRCGAYSSGYGLDGKVPADLAEDLGSHREVSALVNTGLWVPTVDGFVMHDFLDWNPSAEHVAAERAAGAERARRARSRRAGQNGHVDA